MIDTGPLTLLAGVKASVPFGLIETLPSTGLTRLATVTLSVPPSRSRSLPNTSMLASGVLIGVDALSFKAIGASLVPVMVTVTTCAVPSIEVTVKVSSGSDWPAPRACTAGSALFSA